MFAFQRPQRNRPHESNRMMEDIDQGTQRPSVSEFKIVFASSKYCIVIKIAKEVIPEKVQ